MKKGRKVPGIIHSCLEAECSWYCKGNRCKLFNKGKCHGKTYVLAGTEHRKVCRELRRLYKKQSLSPAKHNCFVLQGIRMAYDELKRIGGGE